MSYFNIGDKVVCVCKDEDNWYKIGSEFTIRSAPFVDTQDNTVCYHIKEEPSDSVWIQGSQFKLTKEEPKQMFNIKTDPWFIRVNSEEEFEVIQDWLEENYGEKIRANYGTHMKWLTNTQCDGHINSKLLVMYGSGEPLATTPRKEIKLTFKTTIDSVQYPEMETEQQIKMKQLQETIDKAARELKELREMGENK